jgi:hypothetical protein
MGEYLAELRDAVQPLASEFSLDEVTSEENLVVISRLSNSTTGVALEVNWQELRVFVTLVRLTPKLDFANADDLTQPIDGKRYGFDADVLFKLRRTPNAPIGGRVLRMAPGEIDGVVRRYVESLASAAKDVLRGDFSVFADLGAIVDARDEQSP